MSKGLTSMHQKVQISMGVFVFKIGICAFIFWHLCIHSFHSGFHFIFWFSVVLNFSQIVFKALNFLRSIQMIASVRMLLIVFEFQLHFNLFPIYSHYSSIERERERERHTYFGFLCMITSPVSMSKAGNMWYRNVRMLTKNRDGVIENV